MRHLSVLKDNDPFVRMSAASTLGDMGPAAKPANSALKETNKDEIVYDRDAAHDAILKLEGAET